jgi:hypothetical protein
MRKRRPAFAEPHGSLTGTTLTSDPHTCSMLCCAASMQKI